MTEDREQMARDRELAIGVVRWSVAAVCVNAAAIAPWIMAEGAKRSDGLLSLIGTALLISACFYLAWRIERSK
jgi:hypothetical protein